MNDLAGIRGSRGLDKISVKQGIFEFFDALRQVRMGW
jgi:hypothetical protein